METMAQVLTSSEEEFDIVLGDLEQDVSESKNVVDHDYRFTTCQSWYCI